MTPGENAPASGTERIIQPVANEVSASASEPPLEVSSNPSEQSRSNPSLVTETDKVGNSLKHEQEIIPVQKVFPCEHPNVKARTSEECKMIHSHTWYSHPQ